MANLAGGGAIRISRLHARNTAKAWEALEGQSLESGPKMSPLIWRNPMVRLVQVAKSLSKKGPSNAVLVVRLSTSSSKEQRRKRKRKRLHWRGGEMMMMLLVYTDPLEKD